MDQRVELDHGPPAHPVSTRRRDDGGFRSGHDPDANRKWPNSSAGFCDPRLSGPPELLGRAASFYGASEAIDVCIRGVRMALWDRIKESASTMQTQLVAKKNDLKSGAFRDASMAMCALVAAADGTIDPAERQRVAQLIATNEVLQNFPADDLRRRFEENLNKLTADFAFGKVSVLQEVAKAKKKPAEARAVIQIGIVIGGADGDFDKTEQAVVREACFTLDLPPHEFDL
jgi:tellurite resistance protein TerB